MMGTLERYDGGNVLDDAPPTRTADDDRAQPLVEDEAAVPWPLVGGRYVPRRQLGRGGMASVFEAVDLVTGAVVALKRPHLLRESDPHLGEVMTAEARAMARVAHPNIARVLDAGVDPQGPWFVMEKLVGESLHARIARSGKLSLSVTTAVMLPLLAGVDAVHECGLAHGDIKPANVILARRGERTVPTLIDFGVATHVDASDEQAAEVLGTPMFMAPERFVQRARPDVPSDIWSLGAVLYTCLAGGVPFHGKRVADVVFEVLTRTPPEVPGMLPAVRAVIDRAMRREPADRFRSARAMAAALRDAVR